MLSTTWGYKFIFQAHCLFKQMDGLINGIFLQSALNKGSIQIKLLRYLFYEIAADLVNTGQCRNMSVVRQNEHSHVI